MSFDVTYITIFEIRDVDFGRLFFFWFASIDSTQSSLNRFFLKRILGFFLLHSVLSWTDSFIDVSDVCLSSRRRSDG